MYIRVSHTGIFPLEGFGPQTPEKWAFQTVQIKPRCVISLLKTYFTLKLVYLLCLPSPSWKPLITFQILPLKQDQSNYKILFFQPLDRRRVVAVALVIVISHWYQSLSLVIVISHCHQSLLLVIVISQCHQSFSLVIVISHCH